MLNQLCTCRRRRKKQIQRLQMKGVSLFRRIEMNNNHAKECPLFFREHRIEEYGIRSGEVSALLTQAVEIALGQCHGSGGYSIASSLSIRKIYRPKSAAFIDIRRIIPRSWDLERLGKDHRIMWDGVLVR